MFDFAETTNDDATTTTTTDDVSPDFESNETAGIYLSLTDTHQKVQATRSELGYDSLKIWSDDTLENFEERMDENPEAHPMQELEMLYALARSTAGKAQQDNDHAIGLVDGKAPDSHDEVSQDHSYALHFSDLPSITTEGFDGGERESLEDMGIDPDSLGFNGEPQILAIDGKRLPIVVEEGNEIDTAKSILSMVPDEPSKWTEDGFVESSDPEVFDSEGSDDSDDSTATDKADDGDDPTAIISDPGLIGNFNVQPSLKVIRQIDSKRTIQRIKQNEQQTDRSSKTIIDLCNDRIEKLSESDDSEVTIGEDNDLTDDDKASVGSDDSNDLPAYKDLSEVEQRQVGILMDNGEADSQDEAIRQMGY